GDTLRGRFLEPHPAPARTAAEGFFSVARHFAKLRVGSSAKHGACRIDFPIDPSQVTRVVQGDRLPVTGTVTVTQPSRPDQFCEQARVMLDLVLPSELRVFVLE